jgi:thioredoxin 1
MHRRDFLLLTTAVSLAPTLLRAETLDYTPGLVDERLARGETLFVDFKASWCTTCAAQERVIGALRGENPAYDAAITFINVDWDLYADDALTRRLAIPRRSTLVVLKGDQELGRIVAGTARDQIAALLDLALSAATA